MYNIQHGKLNDYKSNRKMHGFKMHFAASDKYLASKYCLM